MSGSRGRLVWGDPLWSPGLPCAAVLLIVGAVLLSSLGYVAMALARDGWVSENRWMSEAWGFQEDPARQVR